MNKRLAATGAFLALLAVALGAFGAHGLKKLVPADTIQTFQTGVHYQMVHALALLLTGLFYEKCSQKLLQLAGIFFITGILLFSGSLYLLTVFRASEITGWERIGIVTPIGGLAFIAGWLCLLLGILSKK